MSERWEGDQSVSSKIIIIYITKMYLLIYTNKQPVIMRKVPVYWSDLQVLFLHPSATNVLSTIWHIRSCVTASEKAGLLYLSPRPYFPVPFFQAPCFISHQPSHISHFSVRSPPPLSPSSRSFYYFHHVVVLYLIRNFDCVEVCVCLVPALNYAGFN